MNQTIEFEPCMVQAYQSIDNYITQTTGTAPSQEEVASALTKFFVLKEIGEFIEMSRQENPSA